MIWFLIFLPNSHHSCCMPGAPASPGSEPIPTSRSLPCASAGKSFPRASRLVHFHSLGLSSEDTSPEWFSLATLFKVGLPYFHMFTFFKAPLTLCKHGVHIFSLSSFLRAQPSLLHCYSAGTGHWAHLTHSIPQE